MPTPLTGSARFRSGKWYARVTIERGKRMELILETCRESDEEKARDRANILADIAKRLRAAGHAEAAPALLERAAARDGRALEDVISAVERICSGAAAAPVSPATTFRDFATQWTDGTLHRRWPDHVKKKATAKTDAQRLELYVYPVIGSIPLAQISLAHADEVLSQLPERLSPASRRHVAQAIARVLKLAAYPARIIPASPIPPGFLPGTGKRKALTFLYPDEDRALLACPVVPLASRVLYGFLAREGLRRGEAAKLTWANLDLEHGVLTLDENKTEDPRAWALDEGVVAALRAWHLHCGEPGPDELVFVDDEGLSVADRGDFKEAARLREHLTAAGVQRAELFERSEVRQPFRVHDLRATFVTVSLANGRTETWVADRTGHKSSVMINRYRRAARSLADLGLGPLTPLHEAVPELRELAPGPAPGPDRPRSDRGHDEGQDPSEASLPVVSRDPNSAESNGPEGSGSWRTRTSSQWIKSPHHASSDGPIAEILRLLGGPNGPERDLASLISTASALIGGGSRRAQLVRLLGVFQGLLATDGDVSAARVAHEAIGRLLDASGPAEGESGARVWDLAERRRDR